MADLPDWLQGASTQTISAPNSPALPDWMEEDKSGPAREAVRLSSGIAPDKAAQVLKISDQTNLPTDFVSRNTDALQTQRDNAAITPQFSQQAPVVTAHMAEDPHQAALTAPDAGAWGWVERQLNYMGQQSAKGMLDTEGSLRKAFKLFGYSGADNDARIKEIEMEKQYGLNQPAPGPISGVVGSVVEGAPAMVAAGGVGALGTMASVPAGIGAATAWGFLGAGDAFHQYVNSKDANGNPISENIARGAAIASGIAQGAGFALGGKILEEVPAFRMLLQENVSSLIKSPTLLSSLGSLLEGTGKTALTMGGYSGYGDLAKNAYGELAKMKSEGALNPGTSLAQILSRIFSKENLASAGKASVHGAESGLVLGLGGGAIDSNYSRYSSSMKAKDLYYVNNYMQAQRMAEGWKNIGNVIENTKMNKLAPEQVEKLVSKIAPNSQLYVPFEQWQTYWEDKKVDPRTAFLGTVGNTKSYDESLRSGTDLQIPAGKYAANIAPTEHNEFFSQHLKVDPLDMSANDAEKSVKIKADMEKEEAKEKIANEVSPKIPEPLPAPETEPITAAQDVQGMQPLFPRPTAEGMKEDLAGRYRGAIDDARGKAQENFVRDRVDRELKEKSASWLSERAKVQEDVEARVSQDPGQIALSSLRNHQTPDGAEIARISRTAIERDYPELSSEKLPDAVSLKEGGIHPDDAAARLGYNSGSELLHDLMTLPDKDELVKQQTDEEMLRRHPEAGSGVNIMDKAMDAAHNDKRAQVLRMELQHLASDDFAAFKGLMTRINRRLQSSEELKADVRKEIGSKTTAETQPNLYLQGERIANREAFEHFKRGDFEAAFDAKQAELRNHELYRAAREAKDDAVKNSSYMQKFESDSVRARIGKAEHGFLESIDAIRAQFSFGNVSLKQLEKFKGLREWYDEQKAAGENPIVPPDLLERAQKKSWKEMTNDELSNTTDYVRNIEHLAGRWNKVLESQKERALDDVVTQATGIMGNRFKVTEDMLNKNEGVNPDFATRFKNNVNGFGSWLTRKEPLFRDLGIHDLVYDRLNDAEDYKTSRNREATDRLNEITNEHYSKWERATFSRMTYIPELEGTKIGPNLDRMQRIMTLLHGGNDGNFKEMLNGYKISESQVRSVWKTLEPKDVQFAQKILDFVGSYRNDIGKQERELNGLEPKWVNGRPIDVTIKDGSTMNFKGGYFPLVYDRNMSYRTAALNEIAMTKDMFPSYSGNTATEHNWTKARVGGGGQSPSLNFSVFTDHVFDVIHDLAYRKPVIDTYKLINDPRMTSMLEATAGKGEYSQLNPWLKRIAGDRAWDPLGPLQMVKNLSNNMTATELGFKVGSALVHTSSLFPASRELKGYMFDGFKTFSNPVEAIKFMFDSSEFMRSRWQDAGDRDIRSAASNLNLTNQQRGFFAELRAMSPIQQKDAWIIMKSADMAIAGPTWYGAYLKAMDGKVKGIDYQNHEDSVSYADQLVRDTKGSGAAKDLAPYQTAGGSVGGLFTKFQTQLNVILNQMISSTRQYGVDKSVGKLAGAAMMQWIMPALATELLRGRTPKSDESWVGWGAKAIGKFPLLINPITNPVVRYYENERNGFTLIPAEEALATMAKTGKNLVTKNPIADKITGDDSEWSDQDYQDAALTLSYALKIPGMRQATQSWQRMHQWMSGAENPESPIAGIGRVLIGTKKPE